MRVNFKIMGIPDLFNAIVCCSCGLCCSSHVLCDECTMNTLKANGVSEEYAPEFKDLSYKSRNHGNRFEFSDFYYKLSEVQKSLTKN